MGQFAPPLAALTIEPCQNRERQMVIPMALFWAILNRYQSVADWPTELTAILPTHIN